MENDDNVGQEPGQTAAPRVGINADDKAHIYYDHYKDTYEQVKDFQKKRDWYLGVLLILLSIILLFLYDTDESFSAMQGAAESGLGIKDLSLGLVDMICVCLLTYFSLAYYRTCLNIERLYIYIHNIEFNLSSMIELNIDREGKSYLSSYPWLLSFAHFIYTYGIPAFIVVTIIAKSILTFHILPSLYGIVESFLLLVTLISTIAYVRGRVKLSRS